MISHKRYRVPKIVVSGGRGRWLRLFFVLLLVLAAAWLGFQQGQARPKGIQAIDRAGLNDSLNELKVERGELRRKLAMAEQVAKVDREAMRAVREQIKQFQDERLKMEEELVFLRGIVSTDTKKEGLRIQNYKLEPGLESGQFLVKFSVSQVLKSGPVAKGRIFIRVEGLQPDGKAKTFGLEELTEDKTPSIKMRFRYFQNVEGKLKLPDDFKPASLTIEVKPSNKKLAPVTETYEWSPQA